MQSSAIAYIAILATLALLSQWLLETVQSALDQGAPNTAQGPVMYIDDFLATRMNSQGILQYTLEAPHLVELPEQQGTRVKRPVMRVFQSGQILAWLIRADRGWLSNDDELIKLHDHVSLTRPPSAGKKPIVITTRNVLVRPKESYAETPEAARAEIPGGVLEGIGVEAYFHEEKVRLLSHVRGSYVPPKP